MHSIAIVTFRFSSSLSHLLIPDSIESFGIHVGLMDLYCLTSHVGSTMFRATPICPSAGCIVDRFRRFG